MTGCSDPDLWYKSPDPNCTSVRRDVKLGDEHPVTTAETLFCYKAWADISIDKPGIFFRYKPIKKFHHLLRPLCVQIGPLQI